MEHFEYPLWATGKLWHETTMIVIVGAGIAGLTLGCALAQKRIPFSVYERAAALLPVGAGITVQRNALTALRNLGLADAVLQAGQSVNRSQILDDRGRVLTSVSLDGEWVDSLVAIHRGKLQALLLAALGQDVHCGHALREFGDRGDAVQATFDVQPPVFGTALVGADGLHSTVRRQLSGNGATRYAGYTSWRGVCPAVDFVDPVCATESWGAGQRFGVVPIGDGEVYWFAVVDAPPGGTDGADVRADLLARFAGWHVPIERLIAGTPPDRILRTDISDRPPERRWSHGCVTLLGDAAHPMTPNLGQGGCQAIEDAVVLAACLAAGDPPDQAFTRYEAKRLTRANHFVRRSRSIGGIGQWRNPVARLIRDTALRLTPTNTVLKQMRKAWTLPED